MAAWMLWLGLNIFRFPYFYGRYVQDVGQLQFASCELCSETASSILAEHNVKAANVWLLGG